MSDWLVHLLKLGALTKHPDADTLEMCEIYGQNVLCKKGEFQEGDLVVFIPPDTKMPSDPEHPLLKGSSYLKPNGRVKAVRLRGIFSNGMIVPAKLLLSDEQLNNLEVGTHVAELIGLTKWEDQGELLSTAGEDEKDRGYMPCYTDIDGWPKFRNKGIINPGDEVVLTEKIHGCNARYTYQDGRLWVGSRTRIKKSVLNDSGMETNLWWKVARDMNLEEKLSLLGEEEKEDVILFGEIYGQVQDLKYGVTSGAKFRIFDTFSKKLGRYNDWDVTKEIAQKLDIETVPELFRGPWAPELEELRNGKSVLYPGNIREGFVIKPIHERYRQHTPGKRAEFTGRIIFKYVGEDYKLRK